MFYLVSADQIFGDQEMHSVVRRDCVDYMVIVYCILCSKTSAVKVTDAATVIVKVLQKACSKVFAL